MIKTVLKIDGMACCMCESHINDCIRQHFSIKKIKSSHTKGESEILSENVLDEERLKKVISDIGYTLISLTSDPYVKKSLFGKE